MTGTKLRLVCMFIALALAAGCQGMVGPEGDNSGRETRTRGAANAGTCCVWIDLDGTLNTVGAFGYPFNPVPADEACTMLVAKKPQVRTAFLTARKGCLPAFKPGEKSCQQLEDTVSVACSTSGTKMALAKQQYMAAQGQCAAHILVDNNKAAAGIKLAVPYIYIEPKAFAWPSIRQQINDAVKKCTPAVGPANPGPANPGPANPGSNPGNPNPGNPNPGNPGPGPLTCQGHCGKQAPSGCWCDPFCKTKGDCCPDAGPRCGIY